MDLVEQLKESLDTPGKYQTLAPTEFPVGTIIPFTVPPGAVFQLPPGWILCAGQPVPDPESPFYLRSVPQLMDGRFPMGSLNDFGKTGGSNVIPSDGSHAHEREQLPRGRGGFGDDNPDNQYRTQPAGAHDHGGENRPAFYGLAFMIKIKA